MQKIITVQFSASSSSSSSSAACASQVRTSVYGGNCLMSCVCFRGCLPLAWLFPRRRFLIPESRKLGLHAVSTRRKSRFPTCRNPQLPRRVKQPTLLYGSLRYRSGVTSLPCILLHHTSIIKVRIHASSKDGANFLLFIRSLYQSHHDG